MTSCAALSTEIGLYKGDDKTFRITVTDNSSPAQPLDLTGYTLRFTAKNSASDETAVISKTSAVSGEIDLILTGDKNQADIIIDRVDTVELSIGPLVFDIEAETPAGKFHTIVVGSLNILQDVTGNVE